MIEQNIHDIAGREKHQQFMAAADMHRRAKGSDGDNQVLSVMKRLPRIKLSIQLEVAPAPLTRAHDNA